MSTEAPRFSSLSSRIVPLLIDDVDTDQIIPAEYLKVTGREGLAEGLFAAWRQDPECALHREVFQGAEVLLAGENFGCGSSREHAPWALLDYGFRAVLSPCFADIFRINALRNGLLTIAVDRALHQWLAKSVGQDPTLEITIDLERSTLTLPAGSPFGAEVPFEVDPFARRCLLDGVDQLGYLLQRHAAIASYETNHPARFDSRQPAGEVS
ncbi:MAG: 3-isopropylmalate dehydratase small subunit [Acidobacteriota bacterium]